MSIIKKMQLVVTLSNISMNTLSYSQTLPTDSSIILKIEEKILEQVRQKEKYVVQEIQLHWPEPGDNIRSEEVTNTSIATYFSNGVKQVVTIYQYTDVPSGPFHFYRAEEHYYFEGKLYFVFARYSNPQSKIEITEHKIYFPNRISRNEMSISDLAMPIIVYKRTYDSSKELPNDDLMHYGEFLNLSSEHKYYKVNEACKMSGTTALTDAISKNDLLLHLILAPSNDKKH